MQYCIWLGAQSHSRSPGRSLLHLRGRQPSRQGENSRTSHSMEKLCGGNGMRFFDCQTRRKRGRVTSSQHIPERAACASSLPWSVAALFWVSFIRHQLSHQFFSILLSLSLSITVLPSFQCVHAHPNPISPPDTLAGEILDCFIVPLQRLLISSF